MGGGYPALLPNGNQIFFTGSHARLCSNSECTVWSDVVIDGSDGPKENPGVIIDRAGRPVFAYTSRICCDGTGYAAYTLKISRCSNATCQQVSVLYSTSVSSVPWERVRIGLSPKGLTQVIFSDQPAAGTGARRVRLITCSTVDCATATTSVITSSSSFEFRYFDAIRNRLTGNFNIAYVDEDLSSQTLWFRSCSSTACDDESTMVGTGFRGVSTGIGVDGLPFLVTAVGNTLKFIRCSSQDCVPYSR
jgi:hypothetical protein